MANLQVLPHTKAPPATTSATAASLSGDSAANEREHEHEYTATRGYHGDDNDEDDGVAPWFNTDRGTVFLRVEVPTHRVRVRMTMKELGPYWPGEEEEVSENSEEDWDVPNDGDCPHGESAEGDHCFTEDSCSDPAIDGDPELAGNVDPAYEAACSEYRLRSEEFYASLPMLADVKWYRETGGVGCTLTPNEVKRINIAGSNGCLVRFLAIPGLWMYWHESPPEPPRLPEPPRRPAELASRPLGLEQAAGPQCNTDSHRPAGTQFRSALELLRRQSAAMPATAGVSASNSEDSQQSNLTRLSDASTSTSASTSAPEHTATQAQSDQADANGDVAMDGGHKEAEAHSKAKETMAPTQAVTATGHEPQGQADAEPQEAVAGDTEGGDASEESSRAGGNVAAPIVTASSLDQVVAKATAGETQPYAMEGFTVELDLSEQPPTPDQQVCLKLRTLPGNRLSAAVHFLPKEQTHR